MNLPHRGTDPDAMQTARDYGFRDGFEHARANGTWDDIDVRELVLVFARGLVLGTSEYELETVVSKYRAGVLDGLEAWAATRRGERRECPRCHSSILLVSAGEGEHMARIDCDDCHRFVAWIDRRQPAGVLP